jgi:hypothetical protein
MLETTVEFCVSAPVAGVGSDVSPTLDALASRWRDDPSVSSVAVEWKALPREGGALIGSAELHVGLRAQTRPMLRRAYERLTRQVARNGDLRFGGRNCVLTDMFG